jgi:serine/threonine-protein kinase RsbW
MNPRRIRLTIDSRLDHLARIGRAVGKLRSFIPLSALEAYQIELCVVEAETNSIKHAYRNESDRRVEVTFALYPDKLRLKVCDTGRPMDQKLFKEKTSSSLEIDPKERSRLPETGRGLAIIREIMDTVAYRTDKGRNTLVMTKKIDTKFRKLGI